MIETGFHNRAASRLSKLKSPYFLILVAAFVLKIGVEPLLLQLVTPWRRPVQDWMMAHGLGAYATKYALLNLKIPTILLNLVGGAIVGLLLHTRWLRFSLWLSIVNLMSPWLCWICIIGSLSSYLAFGAKAVLIAQFIDILAIVPTALAGSYIGSRLGARRYARLHPAGNNCTTCGYNLTANVSGRCPECGKLIEPSAIKSALSNTSDLPSKPN